jgi:hypothetical protein
LNGFAGNDPIGRFDADGLSWTESIGLFGDWVSGSGEQFRYFGPASNQAGDMKSAPGVNKARDFFTRKNRQALCCEDLQPVTNFKATFGPKGLWDAGLNSTRQFVGSYKINITVRQTAPDKCEIRFLLFNTTSATSFFYGLFPSWERKWFFKPGGNIDQVITWTETYNLSQPSVVRTQ